MYWRSCSSNLLDFCLIVIIVSHNASWFTVDWALKNEEATESCCGALYSSGQLRFCEALRIKEINTQHKSQDPTQTHPPKAILPNLLMTLKWPYSVIVPSSPLRGWGLQNWLCRHTLEIAIDFPSCLKKENRKNWALLYTAVCSKGGCPRWIYESAWKPTSCLTRAVRWNNPLLSFSDW